MKKTLLLFAFALGVISFNSCEKNYSCECTVGAISLSEEWEGLSSEEAEGAEKACDESNKIALFTNDSCSFKSD
ncbi:MAG: hypothetical protein ACJA0Q_000151 [Saprospiraceae bacterium]|jgi:hypothetical protein